MKLEILKSKFSYANTKNSFLSNTNIIVPQIFEFFIFYSLTDLTRINRRLHPSPNILCTIFQFQQPISLILSKLVLILLKQLSKISGLSTQTCIVWTFYHLALRCQAWLTVSLISSFNWSLIMVYVTWCRLIFNVQSDYIL